MSCIRVNRYLYNMTGKFIKITHILAVNTYIEVKMCIQIKNVNIYI
jgi:hypothetical protein